MIQQKDYVLLGKITKKWGFEGHFILITDPAFTGKQSFPESVFLALQGKLIPFFIESIREKGENSMIISFMDVTETLLDRITGCEVYGNFTEPSTRDSSSSTLERLFGYQVVDQSRGFIGTVKTIEERAIQPLLIIDNQGLEILIPFAEELIEKINHRKKTLYINTPEGLIDLYLPIS